MMEAGVCVERSLMREAAGWMRSWRASKSRFRAPLRLGLTMTSSPSRTQRVGSWARRGARSSGK